MIIETNGGDRLLTGGLGEEKLRFRGLISIPDRSIEITISATAQNPARSGKIAGLVNNAFGNLFAPKALAFA